MKQIVAIVLLAAILLSLPGCTQVNAADLMEGVRANPVAAVDVASDSASITDFCVRLFHSSMETGKNTLISPLSVLYALSMTANGAVGNTLSQMEEVLGLPSDTLNSWLHAYMDQLPQTDTYKLSLANSIWFKDDPSFSVKQEFLQTNADYYNAGIYKAPFDAGTCEDINNWVEDNTDGMINEILDEIPEEAVMYLVNALAFDAQWQEVYEENQIRNGIFTTEDGAKQTVELMHSTEGKYLEDDSATGFIKYYDDRKYAFAALLPNEGVSVKEYVAGLAGEHLDSLLSDPQSITVYTAIPKFQTQYDVEMSEILRSMGMTDAFDSAAADFSNLGSSTAGNLFISRVLHKTYICVDTKGTRAGAVTTVEVNGEGAAEGPQEYRTVNLDRPFVYMLIDCETNLPFFIGTMMDMTGE